MDFLSNPLVTLILGAVIATIINYFTHFTSPILGERYAAWKQRREQEKALRSKVSAIQRIEELKADLQQVQQFKDERSQLYVYGFYTIARLVHVGISMFVVLYLFLGLSIIYIAVQFQEATGFEYILLILSIGGTLLFEGMRITIINGTLLSLTDKLVNYDTYVKRIERQIAELEKVAHQQPDQQQG